MTRREFAGRLKSLLAVFAVLSPFDHRGLQAADPPATIGLDPSLVDDWLTPSELFFVREHFPVPEITPADWTLSITGAVERPYSIRYEELLQLPRRDLAVTFECAGNPPGGGLVSNAEWHGVSLPVLLKRAKPAPAAKYVRFKGADGVAGRDECYFRSVPLEKALHPDTLAAYGMNGRSLPAKHGFPLRAVISGWYSMDSVKWLREIEVHVDEDTSPLMMERYRRQIRAENGSSRSERVTAMNVKAAFSRPVDGAILTGRRMVLRGMAWAGERAVKRVDLSLDGGSSWIEAHMPAGSPRPYAWVAWEHEWSGMQPGRYELLVRAIDDQGTTQPEKRADARTDPNELNHYQRVRCVVV